MTLMLFTSYDVLFPQIEGWNIWTKEIIEFKKQNFYSLPSLPHLLATSHRRTLLSPPCLLLQLPYPFLPWSRCSNHSHTVTSPFSHLHAPTSQGYGGPPETMCMQQSTISRPNNVHYQKHRPLLISVFASHT